MAALLDGRPSLSRRLKMPLEALPGVCGPLERLLPTRPPPPTMDLAPCERAERPLDVRCSERVDDARRSGAGLMSRLSGGAMMLRWSSIRSVCARLSMAMSCSSDGRLLLAAAPDTLSERRARDGRPGVAPASPRRSCRQRGVCLLTGPATSPGPFEVE